MRHIVTSAAVAAAASLAIIGAAQAQVTVPPGQDFYATPMQKGPMMMMPQSQIAQPAPAKMMMKKKMMKKKMMMKKMKRM